jgi:hypothetical protein
MLPPSSMWFLSSRFSERIPITKNVNVNNTDWNVPEYLVRNNWRRTKKRHLLRRSASCSFISRPTFLLAANSYTFVWQSTAVNIALASCVLSFQFQSLLILYSVTTPVLHTASYDQFLRLTFSRRWRFRLCSSGRSHGPTTLNTTFGTFEQSFGITRLEI